MGALIPQTAFAHHLLAPVVESYECPIRDANTVVSVAVGGSLCLFIISETVDKFSRSDRVQHPGREVLTTSALLYHTNTLFFVVEPIQCISFHMACKTLVSNL